MKQKRGNVVLGCIALIGVLTLSACGGNTSLPSADSGASAVDTAPTEAADNPSATTGEADTANDTDNSSWPTLHIATSIDARSVPPEDMMFEKKYNEMLQINVRYTTLPGDAAKEKKNLMLASNDLPDAFMGLIDRTDIMTYKDKGTFIAVDDLVENNMPLLKAIYEKYPEYKQQATTTDGKMYGFPRVEEMYGLILNQGILSINVTWLDKLGLSMPKTLDEYRDVLRAFRDGDPNGNGLQDEIPFTTSGAGSDKGIGNWVNGNDIGQFMGCFGEFDPGDSLKLDANGKIYSSAMTDAFKEGYKYFHSMYAEGLIDEEIYNNTEAMLAAKLREPEAIVGSAINFAIADRMDAERLKEYAPVPYLTGPGGEMGGRENMTEMHSPSNFVITSACGDPTVAAKYADGTYDPVMSVETNWGPLDYVYKFDENGQMVWGELKDGLDNFDDMRAVHVLAARHPLGVFNDYYGTVVEYPQNAQYLLDTMNAVGFVDKHLNDPFIPPQWYETADAERLAILSTQVYGTIDTTRRTWIFDGGVDEGWDAYLQSLRDNGIDEMIAIIQKAYDRSKS